VIHAIINYSFLCLEMGTPKKSYLFQISAQSNIDISNIEIITFDWAIENNTRDSPPSNVEVANYIYQQVVSQCAEKISMLSFIIIRKILKILF
jgi:hypothetical protein